MNIYAKKLDKMRLIATVYLVAMCVQIVLIEGLENSWIKIGLMGLAPLLWVIYVPKPTPALMWGFFYLFAMFFCASLHKYMRFSTIGFSAMYVGMYIFFYGLIDRKVFSLDFFIRVLSGLIFAYFICLVLQQVGTIVGLRTPLFNMTPFDRMFKWRSLGIEPSHSARIMGCAFYCYLYCLQLRDGVKPTLIKIFAKEHRRVTLSFLWIMLTMGSGTAFVTLAIISLFFLSPRTMVYILPVLVFVFMILLFLELENFQRVLILANAISLDDSNEAILEEGSGAARILPIINTIRQFDLTSHSFLFGEGTLEQYDGTQWKEILYANKIGIIEQYGLLTWLVNLILVYKCMIRRVFSIETLLFIVLLGLNLGNIAYAWAMMMMFTVVKYFDKRYKKR